MQNVSIDSVKILEAIPAKGKIVLSIKGVLPNPAYEIKRVDTKIEKNTIMIMPFVVHDANKIVIQMMIPFEKKIVISGLEKKKKYKIKVGSKVYIDKYSF